MSKIQITDINLDGSELFNDSETFLNELKDSEIDQIVGGLSQLQVSGDDDYVKTTVYIPKEPICYPIKPIKPICWYPIKPICWYPKPIDEKPSYPIKPIYNPCPVIL